ncbi:MAG: hypothetical protein IME98_05480 [Proteobacteria bacterium]|nr:hypothetical protein [Pseudomonadota bacterium]
MKSRFFILSFCLITVAFFLSVYDSYAMSSRPGARLDDATRECMKCHNMEAGKHFGPSHTSHVVGADYEEAAKVAPSLVSPASLDPRIRLIKGRISCITCHVSYVEETHADSVKDRDNPEARAYPLLRVDNSGSGLCLKCHRK